MFNIITVSVSLVSVIILVIIYYLTLNNHIKQCTTGIKTSHFKFTIFLFTKLVILTIIGSTVSAFPDHGHDLDSRQPLLDHQVGHGAGGRSRDPHLAVDQTLAAPRYRLLDEVGGATEKRDEITGRSVPKGES